MYQGTWSRHHSGLGHARSPQLGGEIHFDAAERWNCADLLLMASLHQIGNFLRGPRWYISLLQIGHALGLNPSRDPQSVMFPLYSHTAPRVELGSDDILGLQQIYRRPKKEQLSKEVWVWKKTVEIWIFIRYSHGTRQCTIKINVLETNWKLCTNCISWETERNIQF